MCVCLYIETHNPTQMYRRGNKQKIAVGPKGSGINLLVPKVTGFVQKNHKILKKAT